MLTGQVIEIRGHRQTSRTEKMVWLTAGTILAGKTPAILCKNVFDSKQTRGRLIEALVTCGMTPNQAQGHAARVVQISQPLHGYAYVVQEGDE